MRGEWVDVLLVPSLFNYCCVVIRNKNLELVGLNLDVDEVVHSSSEGWFEEQVHKGNNKECGRDEGIKYELSGKGQALSFCQRLIQLWLRS